MIPQKTCQRGLTRLVILGLIAAAAVLVVLVWLGLAAPRKRHETEEIAQETGYLAVAFHNYYDVTGELPDAETSVLGWQSSWRLSIAPYIQSWKYSQAALSASSTTAQRHAWAARPGNPLTSFFSGEHPPNTRFVAIVGEGTAWDREAYRTMEDLPASALLFVTVPDSKFHWIEPGDWTTDQLIVNLRNLGDRPIALAFKDARVLVVPANISEEILRTFCDVEAAREASRDVFNPYVLAEDPPPR